MSSTTAFVSQTQPAIGFAYGATVLKGGNLSEQNVIYVGLDRNTGTHEVRLTDGKIHPASRTSEADQEPYFEVTIKE